MSNTNPTDNMWSAFVALETALEAEELHSEAESRENQSYQDLLKLCAKLSKALNQVEDSLLDALEEAKPLVQAPVWMQLNGWLTTLAMARAEEQGVCERVDLEQVSEFLEQFRPS